MHSALFSLAFFVIGISARPNPVDVPINDFSLGAVRPDWTDTPQGQRVMPRIDNPDVPTLDGARRKEVLYGPWKVRAGGVLTKFNMFAESPCDDCFVTAIQFTSKFKNGTEVQTSDGIWLHHCLMTNLQRRTSVSPYGSNVIWSGGNEKPTLRLNTRHKFGIDWPSSFNQNLEYMSNLKNDVEIQLAITFEYIEKSQPEAEGYRDAYLIWNSVGTPDYENGKYTLKSSPITVRKSGVLVHGMGHMHDGGTQVDLYVNNRMVCSSKMLYNARPGYGMSEEPNMGMDGHRRDGVAPKDGPGHGGGFGGKHISDPGHCTSFGRVEKGDKMHIQAYYDTQQYGVMSHNGEMEDQMGILRVFIGPD